jgi:hypothetical protein
VSPTAITRHRIAIVVLLLAAVSWFVTTRGCFWWTIDLVSKGPVFTPQPPPRGDGPLPFSIGLMLEQAGTLGGFLLTLGAAMVAAFLVGAIGSWRTRRPLSRRMTRLPMQLGLLALALGLAGAAGAMANHFAVVGQLGLSEYWFETDRSTMPWGQRGLFIGGTILAMSGIVLTTGLALESSKLARDAEASMGDSR